MNAAERLKSNWVPAQRTVPGDEVADDWAAAAIAVAPDSRELTRWARWILLGLVVAFLLGIAAAVL